MYRLPDWADSSSPILADKLIFLTSRQEVLEDGSRQGKVMFSYGQAEGADTEAGPYKKSDVLASKEEEEATVVSSDTSSTLTILASQMAQDSDQYFQVWFCTCSSQDACA